jgi:hypothetical protein
MGWEGLVIARQPEIIEQDAEELWNLSVKNSLFSAALGRKSTAYPLIAGTEGTIINGIFDKKDESGNVLSKGSLSDFCPRYILIDECHQMNWEDVASESPETQYGVIMEKAGGDTITGKTGELVAIPLYMAGTMTPCNVAFIADDESVSFRAGFSHEYTRGRLTRAHRLTDAVT